MERENVQAQIDVLKQTLTEALLIGSRRKGNVTKSTGPYRNTNTREQEHPTKIYWHCNSTGHLKREYSRIKREGTLSEPTQIEKVIRRMKTTRMSGMQESNAQSYRLCISEEDILNVGRHGRHNQQNS